MRLAALNVLSLVVRVLGKGAHLPAPNIATLRGSPAGFVRALPSVKPASAAPRVPRLWASSGAVARRIPRS